MKDMLRTALLCTVAVVAALLVARACSGPVAPPDTSAIDAARVEVERDADRRIDAAWAEAQQLRELELYARIEALVSPLPARSVEAKVAKLRNSASSAPDQTPTDRCTPSDPGWARCPESVLDRLTLRVVDETQRADVATIRLDEEREYRRLDAETWAVERAALRPTAAWRLPAALVGGAAVATGVALAVAGSEEAGAVVGGAGLVIGGAAVAF
jgi:hypothetical protein